MLNALGPAASPVQGDPNVNDIAKEARYYHWNHVLLEFRDTITDEQLAERAQEVACAIYGCG